MSVLKIFSTISAVHSALYTRQLLKEYGRKCRNTAEPELTVFRPDWMISEHPWKGALE